MTKIATSALYMDQNQNLLFKFEQEIARLLLTKLGNFEITLERASQIAKFVLAHLPENLNDAQVRQIAPSLDDEFPELANVVYKHLTEYDQKYKVEEIKDIHELLNHEHFKQASGQASDYLSSKLNL